MEKQEIAVGDSTKLEIIFNSGRYTRVITKRPKIITNEGPQGKRVEIISNVVQRPDSTFPIIIKPYKIDLTQFGQKVRDEVVFKITNVSDMRLNTSMIAIAGDYFEVEMPETISAGETKEAKLKLKKDALGQEFEKSFTFSLNDPEQTRFTVPVKRNLRPALGQNQPEAGEETDEP